MHTRSNQRTGFTLSHCTGRFGRNHRATEPTRQARMKSKPHNLWITLQLLQCAPICGYSPSRWRHDCLSFLCPILCFLPIPFPNTLHSAFLHHHFRLFHFIFHSFTLPFRRFLLRFPCRYDSRNSVWKNAISSPAGADPTAVKCLSVREIGKKAQFTDVLQTLYRALKREHQCTSSYVGDQARATACLSIFTHHQALWL